MSRAAIEFVKVSKKFPNAEKLAVSEVSTTIGEGSFVTILGTSGSGKTTFLKMVNRIYDPTSGEILFFGESIKKQPVEELRRKIGYVIQQIGLFPHMTVAENIATVPKILRWEKQKINARIDELLELVHLPPQDYKTRYPRQLSGGQQQRVGLARAMAADPAIMLMDEPFGAIDAITRQNLQDELIRIQKQLHKTIMFVTHDIHEAFKLGDKVMIMDEGRIQQFDTPFNILFHPANEFVKRLISTEDILQRLRILKAEDIMQPPESAVADDVVRVGCGDFLHNVLARFLENNLEQVMVEDEQQQVVGLITWDQFKSVTQPGKVLSA